MSAEIQPADPRLRIRLLILMTVVALLGALGVLLLNAYLVGLHDLGPQLQPLAAEKAMRAAHAFFAVLLAAAVGFSLYLGRVSRRILASGRFPPPGYQVISDTRVRHGRQARRCGQAGLAAAALTVLLTALVLWQADRLLRQLLDTSLKPTIYSPAELPAPGTPPRRP